MFLVRVLSLSFFVFFSCFFRPFFEICSVRTLQRYYFILRYAKIIYFFSTIGAKEHNKIALLTDYEGITASFFCRVGSNANLPFYSFAAVAERTIPPPAPSPPYRRGGGVALHTSIHCRSLMVLFFSPDGFPTGRDKLGRTPDISPLLAGGNITFATMLHLLH